MKITFIRPNFSNIRSADAMQPLAFAVLAGLTHPDIEIEFYDERIEEIPNVLNTDLVALSVETYTARHAYELSDQFRNQNITVIMGGYHISFMPDEALQHADAIVIGDAELIWHNILNDFRNNTLKRIYQSEHFPVLADIPYKRSIFHNKKYKNLIPVQSSRGCRYFCDFCSVHALYGKKIRCRPISDILRDIKATNGSRFLFVDDNIFSDQKFAISLFKALIPLKIKWACQISIDIALNTDLLDLMVESGCLLVLIGFESLNNENLKIMGKRWNQSKLNYETAIARIRERGIMIYASFLFGYDHDTKDAFKRTVDFALKHKFFIANFNPLTPTPATPLYRRLHQEDRLLYKDWWLNEDFRYGSALFKPINMSPDVLTEGCYWARQEFNRYTSLVSRALEFKANSRTPYRLALYLLSNLISRKEINAKQGLKLGTQNGQDICVSH